MSYAQFVADRLTRSSECPTDLFVRVAQRRGLMMDEARGLHPGSTADDQRFYHQLRAVFASEEDKLEAATAALSFEPSRDRREATADTHRRKPPFFTVRYSPERPDARVLDPGVAMLVKSLPLAGVWSWCSCDGHHGLGDRPNTKVEPARIWVADRWYEEWFNALLTFVRRRVALDCEWVVQDRVIRVEGTGRGSSYDVAFAQDSDMIRMADLFQRSGINERVQSIKSRCRVFRDRGEMTRGFEEACAELAGS